MHVNYGDQKDLENLEDRTKNRMINIMNHVVKTGKPKTILEVMEKLRKLQMGGLLSNKPFIKAVCEYQVLSSTERTTFLSLFPSSVEG